MTPQKEPGKEGLKILLMLASAIIITAGLQAGKQVLLPIVLSGFLAIVSYPITTFFKNKLRTGPGQDHQCQILSPAV